jgi:hypothetical protein
MNLIPHHVIAMTARTPVRRIKYWMIFAIVSPGLVPISGRVSPTGLTTVIAEAGSIEKTRNRTVTVRVRYERYFDIETS